MRILNVISSANPVGGGPIEWVRQFGNIAAQDGHQIEVVSLDHSPEPWMSDFPFPLYPLGNQFNNFYSRGLVPWLHKHAARYDCVIVHGLWRYASYGTWRALRKGPVPYFVYTHGMLDPWFKHTYPLKHLAKRMYWPWTDYRVLRDARGVIFTCEQERLKARESFQLYRAAEQVITLGISAPSHEPGKAREAFLARFPELRNKRLLLFLGRIHPKKGCDILIDAFAAVAAQNNDLMLVFAGPDQTGWIPQLTARAARHGIQERVVWTGMLSGDEKWGAMRCADAFVLSSHQENFGIAVVEAMSCGVPVLISNKVDIWKEIRDAEAGLVSEDTVRGTTEMLAQWLKLTEPARAAMRSNAVRCFQTHFEISHATHQLLDGLRIASART